jgi:TatD DNase family protein
MTTPCCDAHNHLQDERLAPVLEEVVAQARAAGVERCVVNGTREDDWPRVAELARARPDFVIPSFGLHPWHAAGRTHDWLSSLTGFLDEFPSAGLGECGLDRWMRDHDLDGQREVFLAQLSLAAERNLPLSIHCVLAWGPLMDCLRAHPHPERGFLLHSYGGSAEMVSEFVKLGARFSFSGHFLHPRKEKAREAFRRVPLDRLLVETDAPDMRPPDDARAFDLSAPDGEPINHPANLTGIAEGLAGVLELPVDDLLQRTNVNFDAFFGD